MPPIEPIEPLVLRCRTPSTLWRSVEILTSSPENSQLTTKNRPLPEKSAWLGPMHPRGCTSAIVRKVCGSANRMVSCCSTITIARLPSGVK